MEAFIKAISYYLPERVLDNEMLSEQFPEWHVEKISQKTGINQRHIAAEDETSGDMAVKAATKLFEEHGISPASIDYLILCTQSPDYFLPTTACIVQNALGLGKHVGAVDINLGCSGFVYGLGMAKGLIVSEQVKNVLLITSETYSKFIHPTDKSNRTIFGDAASATLISIEGVARLGNFVYGTDGKGAENLIVKNGGMRNRKSSDTVSEDDYANTISPDHLYMNGPEIFSFTLKSVPELVASTLEKNKLEKEDIDLYAMHQANGFMLESIRKKCKIEPSRFASVMENCGNTVSSTIPIVMHDCLVNNRLKTGQKALLAGFGVGYSWAGCIAEMVAD